MTETVLKISDDFCTLSATKLGTKGAWALYVRRRWPQNAVKMAMAEWDLTDGQARGLVFAQASQSTIDDILDHPRGGMRLGLLILEIRFQTGLRSWVQNERERMADEAARTAADAAALGQMARNLSSVLGMGSDGPGGLVERRARERRAFARVRDPEPHRRRE